MTTYINPGNNTGLYGINDININTPYGNANVESFLATGSDTGGNVVGNIVATGNVTATYYFGDGSLLTGIASSYGNTEVSAYLASGTNTAGLTTTGNITGANINGNGSGLSSLTGANVTGTVANATYATSAGSATTAGTVTTAAQGNITSVGTLTSLAVTGNITGGNVNSTFFGSGAGLSSITGANVTGTVGAALESVSAGSATTAGTVTTAAQPNITSVGTLSSLSATGNITGGNINTGGNVTGAYIKGDGSQLTGITATTTSIQNGASSVSIPVSDGNINFAVPTLGTVMKVLAGNGAVTMTQELIVDGDVRAISNGNVSAQGNVTGGNLITGGLVTSTGNITGGNLVTGGLITATGNIGGGNIAAGSNVSAVNANFDNVYTGGITTLGTVDVGGELDVAGNISAPLSRISGGNISASGTGVGFITATANISAGGNIISTGYITAGGNITSTGNIAASYFVGNGSLLTGITTTYGNSNVAAFLPTYTGALAGSSLSVTGSISATSGNVDTSVVNASVLLATGYAVIGANPSGGVTTPGYIVANTVTANTSVTSSGTVSATGNITGGNILTGALVQGATVSATGNVTGSYILGNGSLLTGVLTAAGGSNTQIQYNNGSALGGAAPMTYDNATGNIALGNIIFNPGGSASQINNINSMVVSTGANPGRILIGNGYNGNISNDVDSFNRIRAARLAVWGSHSQGSESVRTSGLTVSEATTLTANTNNNNNARSFAMTGIMQIGGANTYNWNSTVVTNLTAQSGLLIVGTSGNAAVGNITVGAGAGTATSVSPQTGSTLTNGVGFAAAASMDGGTLTNFSAFAPLTSYTAGTAPSSYSVLYNPSSTLTNGVINSNNFRAATEYYFLKNDDNVAQCKLGSLRSYTESNGVNGGTSGDITISKLNGQVQQINMSGNVTSLTFNDFVTSASDSVNTDEQCDTVTVIFNQGATGGYTVAFPAASSTVKYAGGVSALVSTAANSVSLVSISAIRLSGTTTYLITISPGFV